MSKTFGYPQKSQKFTVGLKGKHGKKNVAAVLSMGFFEDNLP